MVVCLSLDWQREVLVLCWLVNAAKSYAKKADVEDVFDGEECVTVFFGSSDTMCRGPLYIAIFKLPCKILFVAQQQSLNRSSRQRKDFWTTVRYFRNGKSLGRVQIRGCTGQI